MARTVPRLHRPRQRHIPQRTCVGCRQERPKRELVRIVRTPGGSVELDPTGKKAGRGVYLCPQRPCWEAALKRERLGMALHIRVDQASLELLAHHAQSYPANEPVSES